MVKIYKRMNLPPKKSILVSLILELNWYIPEIKHHKFGEIPSKPECSRARGLLFQQPCKTLIYQHNNSNDVQTSIDWLIDYWYLNVQPAVQKYISIIFMTRTSSIIHKKTIYRNERRNINGSTTFDCHWKSMESWVRTKKLSLVAVRLQWPMHLLRVFKIYKRRPFSVTLTKHVTHYGPRSGFPYYNLITPIERALYLPTRDAGRSSLWVLSPRNLHTYTNIQSNDTNISYENDWT